MHHSSRKCHINLARCGIFRILKIWIIKYCVKIESNATNCTGHILTVICHLLNKCYSDHLEIAREYGITQAIKRMCRLTSNEHDISELLTAANDLKAHWAKLWSALLALKASSRQANDHRSQNIQQSSKSVIQTIDIDTSNEYLPTRTENSTVFVGPVSDVMPPLHTSILKDHVLSPQDPRTRLETRFPPDLEKRSDMSSSQDSRIRFEEVVDLAVHKKNYIQPLPVPIPRPIRSILKRLSEGSEKISEVNAVEDGSEVNAVEGKRRRVGVVWRDRMNSAASAPASHPIANPHLNGGSTLPLEDVLVYDIESTGGSLDRSVAQLRLEMHLKVMGI